MSQVPCNQPPVQAAAEVRADSVTGILLSGPAGVLLAVLERTKASKTEHEGRHRQGDGPRDACNGRGALGRC